MATKLKVKNCITDHKQRNIETLSIRKKAFKQQEKDVCDVLALRANNKPTLGMIEKRFGRHVTLRDIQNLKAKIKESNNHGQKDAVNTLSFLVDVLQKNCEDRAGVAVDEENILSVVYYQVKLTAYH